ncbi:MAG TPA: biotin/lipoyl-containing protein [Candidatus Humimicrobiaceae bacterium]|jgi:pyruvate/2-oxoglutarate dehydrogenase complex dihydrolipoamide acyltransferase (E2) component
MKKIVIPDVAMGDAEVDILKWYVKEGDRIKKGDVLVDVESEKASVGVESEYDGVITKILHKEGEVTSIGQVIGEIDET